MVSAAIQVTMDGSSGLGDRAASSSSSSLSGGYIPRVPAGASASTGPVAEFTREEFSESGAEIADRDALRARALAANPPPQMPRGPAASAAVAQMANSGTQSSSVCFVGDQACPYKSNVLFMQIC